jgi:phage FluMu gp28-like protein
MFHRLWLGGDKAWSRHRISVYDAKTGGAPHDIGALRAAVADEATWRAAYECQFVDEQHALLPYDLLRSRVVERLRYHLQVEDLSGSGDCYAGYDVGRKRDLSVLVVLERVRISGANDRHVPEQQLRWRGAVELREAPFDEQFDLLTSVLKVRGLHRLAIARTAGWLWPLKQE